MTKKTSKVVKSERKAAQECVNPCWPDLTPLVPTSDLEVEVILDSQIVVIRKLFTKTLCQRYVAFLPSLPLTTTPGTPKKGEALRVNDRFQIHDAVFAETLYKKTALETLIKESNQNWGGRVIGLNPNIRIYRYAPGHFFDQHYDESNQVEFPTMLAVRARTTWTLLLYLTDLNTGCRGGETVFYPEFGQVKNWSNPSGDILPISVSSEAGMALLHKHGDDCLLHEGKEVVAGEKWIIRSDLCVVTP